MDKNKLAEMLGCARDFAHGASNSVASNVSAPVDLLAAALRKAGVPVPDDPVLGARWMAERGLTQIPKNKIAGLLGESAGLAGSALMAAKAPHALIEALRRRDGNLSSGLLSE